MVFFVSSPHKSVASFNSKFSSSITSRTGVSAFFLNISPLNEGLNFAPKKPPESPSPYIWVKGDLLETE